MSLNKDLLTRNAELVKRLKKMKTERDDFESLSNQWKKINNDASRALNLLQRDNQKYQEENAALSLRLDQYQKENRSLNIELSERAEQSSELLSRCSVQQNDIAALRRQLDGQQQDGHSMSSMNTLKFNYERKKDEIEQILHQIHRLFAFCDSNYPQITRSHFGHRPAANGHGDSLRHQSHAEMAEDDGLDDDLTDYDPHWSSRSEVAANGHGHGHDGGQRLRSKKRTKKTRDFMVRRHESDRSPHDYQRRRRSLPSVLSPTQIGGRGLGRSGRLSPHHEEDGDAERDFVGRSGTEQAAKGRKQRVRGHSIVVEEAESGSGRDGDRSRKRREHEAGGPINRELLGPKSGFSQYDGRRTHPFGATQSSHSFFSEQYRYNAVKVGMAGSKLWAKRDSLGGKKKTPRINAIPSSAGSTPLTTPQQSRRGMLDDDDLDDERDFDEDPHRMYLDMMASNGQSGGNAADFVSGDLVSAPTENGPTVTGQGTRAKLTDKGAIHDLFDMLQKETLSATSPVALHHHHQQMVDGMDPDLRDHDGGHSEDAQLVSLLEAEHSSSSDSDSSSD